MARNIDDNATPVPNLLGYIQWCTDCRYGNYPKCQTARARIALSARIDAAPDGQKQAIVAAVKLLQRKGAVLERIRQQMRIRALLEVWLYVHVPLTFALIAALAAHIVSVFFYW